MNDQERKLEIVKKDRLGLLKNLPEQAAGTHSHGGRNLVETRFEAIIRFREENGREPSAESYDPNEMEMAWHLEAFRERPQEFAFLNGLDRYHLLQPRKTNEGPTNEGLANEEQAKPVRLIHSLLKISPGEKEARKIFDLAHVSAYKPISTPDFVAQAKPCEEFARFEPLFRQCQADIKLRKRSLGIFKEEATIKEGRFLVVNGVLAYIDVVDEEEPREDKRPRARVRCIFENGKEIYILRQSLAKSLYKKGQIVSKNNVEAILQLNDLRKSAAGLNHSTLAGEACGEIYILCSESTDPKIRRYDDLFKIGFTTGRTEDRIKNAANEPTYLMAPVSVVSRFPLTDINVQGFETLLHHLFGEARVSIDVYDQNAVRHTVREWFHIPLEIVYEGIRILKDSMEGKIDLRSCRYDRERKVIVIKRKKQSSDSEEETRSEEDA